MCAAPYTGEEYKITEEHRSGGGGGWTISLSCWLVGSANQPKALSEI